MYTGQLVLSEELKRIKAANGYGYASVVKMRNAYRIVE
jgi:hypothetical protein